MRSWTPGGWRAPGARDLRLARPRFPELADASAREGAGADYEDVFLKDWARAVGVARFGRASDATAAGARGTNRHGGGECVMEEHIYNDFKSFMFMLVYHIYHQTRC